MYFYFRFLFVKVDTLNQENNFRFFVNTFLLKYDKMKQVFIYLFLLINVIFVTFFIYVKITDNNKTEHSENKNPAFSLFWAMILSEIICFPQVTPF